MLKTSSLAVGVYEHLITRQLARQLEGLEAHHEALSSDLEPGDSAEALAMHLGRELHRVLASLPSSKVGAQVDAVNALLSRMQAEVKAGPGLEDAQVPVPARVLRAVHRGNPPQRPASPLAQSTLLTRNRSEPALSHELTAEIATADQIDALVAFVTMGGVRSLKSALDRFALRATDSDASPPRMRVLTTVFTGTTEPRALEYLAGLPGVEVRISFDTRRTRLHAKAWLFRRQTGLHTAYVGSANLTKTALGSGHEWMMKVCAADLPHVVEKFQGTFESLWNDDQEFERFDPDDEVMRARLRDALRGERDGALPQDVALTLVALRPYPFQEAILDKLGTERLVHDRWRNLVVAATGTGKTVMAALDYARQVQGGVRPRLLFLAHRKELLEQARQTFRHALQDGAFGELWSGGKQPEQWDHVFATIQSAREVVEQWGTAHFQYVVVDECHHVPASSYQGVVPKLQPKILLGLTATPERMDGKSLLGDFGGRIAAEVRLWHALEKQLLVPFEYYGISDNVDLRDIKWSRSGYQASELSNLYTGDDRRVDLILAQLRARVASPLEIRAIAFCVSVEHAMFMASALSQRGVPATAVHGGSSDEDRSAARRRLQSREINVVCTCELYNEGVDLPFVDTLLLLRPTNSATVFLQQLGRGLRLHEDKESCLVLDFIGKHRAEFGFDAALGALTGANKSQLKKMIEDGLPYLPTGCVLQLDRQAQEQVLESLKRGVVRLQELADDARRLAGVHDRNPTLREFLDGTGHSLEVIYGRKDGSFTNLLAAAGLAEPSEEALDLARRFSWLLHADEPSRLDTWSTAADVAAGRRAANWVGPEQARMAMLAFQLHHRGQIPTATEMTERLAVSPELQGELGELAAVLRDRVSLPEERYPEPDWTLALHRHYGRREILAAVGYRKAGEKASTPQGGILKLAAEKRELLLVTLDKTGSTFSPTTRYKDYAISRDLFHWETQSIASVESESGRRYIESPANGWTFHLFVRETRDDPYAYLGPAEYVSHAGDRPIGITWRLAHGLPGRLFDRYATLAGG